MTERFAQAVYQLAGRESHCVTGRETDDDFSFSLSGIGRFRVNMFRQRGSIAAVVRVISFGLPTAEEAHIPPEVMQVANMKKGIVLVTGAAGSGKSTTLACIINQINHSRSGHILTLEDPVEYIHRHGQCIISQREIHIDCPSYVAALRSACGRAGCDSAGRDAGSGDYGGCHDGGRETGQLAALQPSYHRSGQHHRPDH